MYNLKEQFTIKRIRDDPIILFTFKNQSDIFNLKCIKYLYILLVIRTNFILS